MHSRRPPQPVVSHQRIPGAGPSATPRHGSWHVQAQMGQSLVLMPGQMYFGGRAASMRTLLGSCVAITLWHPAKRIGGMCHFLLPKRERKPDDRLDGRYGDEAVEGMMKMLQLTGTDPKEYVAHLYGGADTMPERGGVRFNIGERNIEQGWSLIDKYGFQLDGVDVGEDIPRTVTLTLACGTVDMRRGSGHAPSLASQQAMAPQATAPMPLHSAPMPFQTAPMPLYSAPMPLHTKPAPLLTQPMPLDPPRVGTPRPGFRKT
jgi:chemotaxis protein CheD